MSIFLSTNNATTTTKVYISDPFNRDVTWITDQMVEEFAGACLRGRRAALTYSTALNDATAITAGQVAGTLEFA
jgi:hypothetical protein